MTEEKNKIIFLVDDDPLYLKSLEIEFKEYTEFQIKTFATGELAIENLSQNPSIIVLDYHLDGFVKDALNGLHTLEIIKNLRPEIPVIMLSSQDKIEVAVNCMHHKAHEYIVKSETAFVRLLKTINSIFRNQKLEKSLSWYKSKQ